MIKICEIPAGIYPIGDNTLPISRTAHTVHLPAFAIAQTTVTNEQFAAFIEGGGYQEERFWTEMGWRWQHGKQETAPGFWQDAWFNAPDLPVVGVCWYEAMAFTQWLALEMNIPWRLPNEGEWEAAARGAEGEAPRPRNYNTAERGVGRAWPVSTAGNISWCGAYDMCGNVWEWCSTRWGRNWQTQDFLYPYHSGDGREDLVGSDARLMRGGSWFDPFTDANPSNRARYLPGSRGSNIGFRLVRSL